MATLATSIGRGTLAARPATMPEGSLYFVTDTSTLYRSNGSTWESVEGGAAYTAENARDDIAAALVEGTGIDITVSDGSDTITIAATAPSGVVPGSIPGWITGRYYGAQEAFAFSTLSAAPLIANRLWMVPVAVPMSRAIDRIGVNVTTAVASSVVRLGLYAPKTTDGSPDALIDDCGTIDSSTTGAKEITIAHTLAAGWVWLACVSGHAVSVGGCSALHGPNVSGQAALTGTSKEYAWFKADAGAVAALPGTFSISGATSTGTGPLPMVRAA